MYVDLQWRHEETECRNGMRQFERQSRDHKPTTPDRGLQGSLENRMGGKYLMDLGWEKMIQVFNVYGQSGGGKEDIAITEAILEAVREEAKAETQGPTLLMGDVNADPSKLQNLRELVEKEGWIDVGLHADWWGPYRAKSHVNRERE